MDEVVPVSLVVAVRNGEDFIAEALESATRGPCVPAEILVVDGHSRDNTRAIAESFPRVRSVVQRGNGISDAYNQGIREARCDLIAFLSHDDKWAPDKLATQLRHLRESPTTDAVVGRARHFLQPGHALPAGFRPELLRQDVDAFIMETLLAPRSTFDRVGPFDTTLHTAHDVDWFSRARDMGLRIDVVASALVHKRVHGANSSLSAQDNTAQLMRVAHAAIRRKRDGG